MIRRRRLGPRRSIGRLGLALLATVVLLGVLVRNGVGNDPVTAPKVQATTAPATTTPASGTTTSAAPTTVPTTTTSPGTLRSVDLTVRAALVGPLVAGRAAYIAVTVGNSGPDTALAPQISVTEPAGLTDVHVVDAAWTCVEVPPTVKCDGPALTVGGSIGVMFQATLSGDVVLQSAQLDPHRDAIDQANDRYATWPVPLGPVPLARSGGRKAQVASLAPLRVGVRDVGGGEDPRPESNMAQIALGIVADTGLAALDARTLHGGLAIAAHTLLTCDATVAACAEASARGDNGSATMTPLNTDAGRLPGTSASSSAALALPEVASVAAAWLLWGAVSMDGSPLPRTNLGTMWLAPPSAAARIVTPSLFQSTGANDFYARADVTEMVRAAGPGHYAAGLVGGLAGVSGVNQSAGWALAALYERPTDPLRSVLVLDGLTIVGGGPAATVSLGSVQALNPMSASTAPVQVGLVAFDGDRGQPDLVCVNGVRLSDAANPTRAGAPCDQLFPTDDIFNATVGVNGAASAATDDGLTMSLGFDADLFSTKLPIPMTSSVLVNAVADVVRLGFMAFVVG